MAKQIIISISREYGTGGHELAEKLSEHLALAFYDRNILQEIADEKQVNMEKLQQYDELPKRWFMSRTVRGMSNSPEEVIANMQFDYLRKKADKGESFVIVGRCSEYVLKDYACMIPIFVRGDMQVRTTRVMQVRNVTKEEAVSIINRHDKTRKAYHNSHCPVQWGDASVYDLTINSSKLGVDGTLEVLKDYVEKRIAVTN